MSKSADEDYITKSLEAPICLGNFITQIETPIPPINHVLNVPIIPRPPQHQMMLDAFGPDLDDDAPAPETPRPILEIRIFVNIPQHAVNVTGEWVEDVRPNTTIRPYIPPPPGVEGLHIRIPPDILEDFNVPRVPMVAGGGGFVFDSAHLGDHSA